MKSKFELKALHGTPAQFKAATLKAVGTISISEAQKAIADYEREYAKACSRHRWKVSSFNESTGVGIWACKCGAVRERRARFICK